MDDQTTELLRALHTELAAARTHRERPHPWYARAPFKEMLAHGSTLCIAVLFALGLHVCSPSTPITIEAKLQKAEPAALSAASSAAAPPALAATTVAVVEPVAASASSAPHMTAPTVVAVAAPAKPRMAAAAPVPAAAAAGAPVAPAATTRARPAAPPPSAVDLAY